MKAVEITEKRSGDSLPGGIICKIVCSCRWHFPDAGCGNLSGGLY